MYKKLLFLLIAIPFSYSTIRAQNYETTGIFRDPSGLPILTHARISWCSTFACGTIATALICAKERSLDKEILNPLITATIVGSGISAISSLALSLCVKLARIMRLSKPTEILNIAKNIDFSAQIGLLAGFYSYSQIK